MIVLFAYNSMWVWQYSVLSCSIIFFFFNPLELQFKKRFRHKFNNTDCIYEQCPGEDSLQHTYICPWNKLKIPEDKNNIGEMLPYLEQLHLERMNRVSVPLYYL